MLQKLVKKNWGSYQDTSVSSHLKWCGILKEVDLTQKYLQTECISLERCNGVINGWKFFFRDQRNEIIEKAVRYASQQCEEMRISMERRGRIKLKKRMPGELAKDDGLTMEEEMRRSMLECVDQFSQELNVRSEAIDNVISTFAAIQPHSLLSANEQQLQESISNMSKIFMKFLKRRSKWRSCDSEDT